MLTFLSPLLPQSVAPRYCSDHLLELLHLPFTDFRNHVGCFSMVNMVCILAGSPDIVSSAHVSIAKQATLKRRHEGTASSLANSVASGPHGKGSAPCSRPGTKAVVLDLL